MHRVTKNRLMAALMGLFFAVTAAVWGLISPVGSSADEGFHLTSIWCAWGVHETCQILDSEDGPTAFVVPAPLTSTKPCFVTEQGEGGELSAACVEDVSDELVLSSGNQGSYPPMYYSAARVFVGPNTEFSVLAIRVFNAVLAGALLAFALAIVRRPIRIALALTWVVGLVPLGLYFIGSINPSSWAIVGVGTYWAFLLNWLGSTNLRSRNAWASLLGVVTAGAMAAGSRSDAGVYIAVSTVAVSILLIPIFRRKPRRLLIVAAPVLIGGVSLAFRFGGPQGLASLPASLLNQPRLENVEYGVFGQILRYLFEIPAVVAGAFGVNTPSFNQAAGFYWGVGYFDVFQPTIVPVLVIATVGATVFWGLTSYSRTKLLALLWLVIVVFAVPIVVLATSNFTTSIFTARYVFPLLLVVIGVAMYRPQITGEPMSKAQSGVIVLAMGIAQSAALLATTRRYTNGQEETWLSFGFEPEWWWTGASHPTLVWLLGSLAFLGFAMFSLRLVNASSKAPRHAEAQSTQREGA